MIGATLATAVVVRETSCWENSERVVLFRRASVAWRSRPPEDSFYTRAESERPDPINA